MSRRYQDDTPPAPPPPPRDRCGRCSDAGLVPVAVHTTEVRVWHVHCSCPLGRHWAGRRAPADGSPVPTPHEFAARWRQRDGVRHVYPFATPGQQRLDLREPDHAAADRQRVSEIMDYIREGRGLPPLGDAPARGC